MKGPSVWSNYSDLTRDFTPNGCLVREMGPLISGKSRLVKYDSIWPDQSIMWWSFLLMIWIDLLSAWMIWFVQLFGGYVNLEAQIVDPTPLFTFTSKNNEYTSCVYIIMIQSWNLGFFSHQNNQKAKKPLPGFGDLCIFLLGRSWKTKIQPPKTDGFTPPENYILKKCLEDEFRFKNVLFLFFWKIFRATCFFHQKITQKFSPLKPPRGLSASCRSGLCVWTPPGNSWQQPPHVAPWYVYGCLGGSPSRGGKTRGGGGQEWVENLEDEMCLF